MTTSLIGKGGSGRGGHGGHHGGGHHHHHGRGRAGWGRGGFWGGPAAFVYDGPGGVDVDDLLDAAAAADQAQAKDVAKAVVRELHRTSVGEDLDLLDAEIVGAEGQGGGGMDFGLSSIFNMASNLAQGGINIYEQQTAKKKAEEAQRQGAAAEQGRLQAAIAADAGAAQAAARAAYSAAQKLDSAEVDRAAAAQALSAQARAGAGLSPASQQKRLEAAENALGAATKKAQGAPKDAYARATMDAWQQLISRLQSGAGAAPGGSAAAAPAPAEGPGWLEGKTGPVPNKVIAGGAALAGIGLLVRAVLR